MERAKIFIGKYYLQILGLLLIMIPVISGNSYYYQVATLCGIYCLFTISVNLVTGFTGQLTLGQVAFYAIGAYASAILSMRLSIPVMVAMLVGGVIAAVFGLLIGFPALRLSGVYLGIATLGFAEIVRQASLIWVDLTRGPLGIPAIPRPSIFGFSIDSGLGYFTLILVILAGVYIAVDRLTKSRVGLVFLSIREDETAAESIGINIAFYKILAFVLSAFIAGLAGAFMAHFITYISPSNFISAESFLVLSMYVLGGPASLPGSIGGAVLLTVASEALRFLQGYRQIFYGVLLITIILFKPEGISGILRANRVTAGLPKNLAELDLLRREVDK
jgi:branched-chain amino acid transport system permease protein